MLRILIIDQLEGIEMPVQDMGPILGEVMKGSYKYVQDRTDDDDSDADYSDDDDHDHDHKIIMIYLWTIWSIFQQIHEKNEPCFSI